MKEISIQSRARTDFIDITAEVAAAVREMAITDGAVVVFNPHTTAAVTINEGADPDVVRDMSAALDRIVPWEDGYHHGEGNAAAHIKASMFGSSVTVLVENGRLMLGTWQAVWFCCFDGPRRRKVWVKKV
jgi:secondary thiamine-phosphate synthase enzyme